MTIERGQLSRGTLVALFRELFREKATGLLRVQSDDQERRFHLVRGDLHLIGKHSLAEPLRALLTLQSERRARGDEPGDSTPSRADLLAQLQVLVQRIADVLVSVDNGEWIFDSDIESLPGDLVGPFPTASLIMEASVRGRTEEELLADLGGEEAKVAAAPSAIDNTSAISIDPGEMFLLSRAESPTTIGELLRQVASDRPSAIRMLARLFAVDLLEEVVSHQAGPDSHQTRLVDTMIERFLDRIGKRLDEDPLALDAEKHRTWIGKLLAQVGSMTHYELLDIGFHDSEEKVHEAYEELARLVHPKHVERLGLVGREGAVRLLFERATLAYVTLADSERRAAYNQEAGIEAPALASPEERSAEESEMGRSQYERALELVENEDWHFALELARQAVRNEPKAEYWALLGRIQTQNPNWAGKAAEAYRNAVRHAPENPQYRLQLATLMEQQGEIERARVHYRAAFQKDATLIEAAEALERLGVSTGRKPNESGLMRVFKRLLG